MGGGENSSDLEQGQVATSFAYANKPSGFVKCGEFCDWLTT